jgi:hypothetical protein
LDDTQGSIPPELAEKPYEFLRTPYRGSSEDLSSKHLGE